MWYLQSDILFRMIISCMILIITSLISTKMFKKNINCYVLFIINVLLLLYISTKLFISIFVYTICTYIFVCILKNIKICKKTFFSIACVLCIFPFIISQLNMYFNITNLFSIIGISYSMLKAIDTLFYVYYTEEKVSIFPYINYMLFFPTFTSGPIYRYRDFKKNFYDLSLITIDKFIKYIKKIILGFFKKLVLLYFVTTTFNFILNFELHWYMSILLVIFSYLIIYLDLSGYSDIAIGMGGMLGYEVPENFKKPWKAPSFTQFWRNWHISLSDWIREHFLILVKNVHMNKYSSALFSFIIMVIMGIWHGFKLPYVLNGFFNGIFISIEILLGLNTFNKRKNSKKMYLLRCFLVNFLFAINSLLYVVSMSDYLKILKGLVTL